jgi:tRNA nucleotidyltransferase (CCA-adding enzyme)
VDATVAALEGEDARMEIPAPSDLLAQIRALPAGAPLMDRLGGRGGVHLVGGGARDLLRRKSPLELDLVVEDDPEALIVHLGGKAVRHERFGTSTVSLDGFSYDLARARWESYPRPGALPEVVPATLEHDLKRRDFSVNAIAIALGGPDAGRVTAVLGGLEDLADGRLRILHDRSFEDDPTRLLRLARYRGRLGFQVEPGTARRAAAALAAGALQTVSGSRIGAEVRLLASEEHPLAGLRALHEFGVDRAIDPRFGLQDEELWRRAVALLPDDGRRDRLVLGLALRDIPTGELRDLLDRLAFEADDRETILATATHSGRVAETLSAAQRPSEIAQTAHGLPLELVALAGALGPAEAARAWLDDLRHVRLEIDGSDLLRAGVAEGPAVGRGLRAALAAKLDGRAVGREAELAAALEGLGGTG